MTTNKVLSHVKMGDYHLRVFYSYEFQIKVNSHFQYLRRSEFPLRSWPNFPYYLLPQILQCHYEVRSYSAYMGNLLPDISNNKIEII